MLISFRHDKLDSEIMGSETERGLQREVNSLMLDVEHSLISGMVDAIKENQDSTHPLTVLIPSTGFTPEKVSKPSVRGEAFLEYIHEARYKMRHLGDEVSDFVLALSQEAHRCLSVLASLKGYTKDNSQDPVSELVGTETCIYRSNDDESNPVAPTHLTGYLVPKRYVVASFSTNTDGEVFKLHVSRDASRQRTSIELTAVVYLVCSGFTQHKQDTPNGNTVIHDVTLPLIAELDMPPVEVTEPQPEARERKTTRSTRG